MAIAQVIREHRVYDGSGHLTKLYQTDESNAVDNGECRVIKNTYSGDDLIDTYAYTANEWQESWNLDKS